MKLDTQTTPPTFLTAGGERLSISETIKRIRKERDLNTAQFGEQIGASARTVEDWEQERRTPRGPTLKMIELVSK